MKRVLLVTYYFPPSGGPGVQRPLKLARYLSGFDWQPHILTVAPEWAAWPELDPDLEQEIPSDVAISRTRSRDPYTWYSRFTGRSRQDAVGVGFTDARTPGIAEQLARWIRANLFIPDARRGWVPFALAEARKQHAVLPFDAVLSTGPPHSTHMVGYALARETGIPHMVDIRDAWPDPSYAEFLPATRWARQRDSRLRNRIIRAADGRVAVTRTLATEMEASTGMPFDWIPNGFDPADFVGIEPIARETFTIVHTGTLPPARNPGPLWKALSAVDAPKRWPELSVRLVGTVDRSVLDAVEQAGLTDRVEIIEYLPHRDAVREMISASLLLLPINRVPEARGIVTGKIYEYLAGGRPVLGLGDPSGEAAAILGETGAGEMVSYENPETVSAVIDRHYAAWTSGHVARGADPEAAARYSRRSQAAEFARILTTMTDSTR